MATVYVCFLNVLHCKDIKMHLGKKNWKRTIIKYNSTKSFLDIYKYMKFYGLVEESGKIYHFFLILILLKTWFEKIFINCVLFCMLLDVFCMFT